ncbi:hypothetical protein [Methylobacterium sp. SI9]|uniref:hypothetical protein n=1 Tax=Methylobacterium guangdongense TaxID=3138811 RepID=UPI00313D2711
MLAFEDEMACIAARNGGPEVIPSGVSAWANLLKRRHSFCAMIRRCVLCVVVWLNDDGRVRLA